MKMKAIKQIKTQEDKTANGEDESTRNLNEVSVPKMSQIQLPPPKPINFLSLRQRFGSILDQYPLPIKFQQLLQTMRNIEQTYWKKRKPLIYDIKNNAFKILQIGQLLQLDKELYSIKIIDKTIQLIPNDIQTENLPEFQQFANNLPNIFEKRITSIRNKLDKLVQTVHSVYLKNIEQQDFEEYSSQFKLYHPTFDLNLVDDIIPIKLPFQIYSEEQRDHLQQIISFTINYFNQRTVSFMYYNNLITHLLTKISISRDTLEKYLLFLIRVQPDFLQIQNRLKEQMKNKWIVQINKQSTSDNQIEQLSTYFY